MPDIEYVRKRDFRIELSLPMLEDETAPDYDQSVRELVESIHRVEATFLYPRLGVDFRQPVVGDVTNSVIRLCKYGIQRCKLRTIFPGRPDLDHEDCSHVIYDYSVGEVVEQKTVMARDALGDDMLVHSVVLLFKKFRVDTNVLTHQPEGQARPPLSLVPDTGSDIVVRLGC